MADDQYAGPIEGARAGIIEALAGANAIPPEKILAEAGYKIVTRAQFDAATDVPAGMRTVAAGVLARWGGDFVVYDPAGGDDGWLLIDDDREQIVGETVEHLGRQAEQPADQPAAPAQATLF